MSLRSERQVVQKPLVRYAIEAGWTYLSQDDALRLRHAETSPILYDTFIQKVQSLNSSIVDLLKAEDIASRFIRVPPTIEGNLQAWEYLKGLKTVFVEAEKRERNLRLVDFDNPGRNAFHVTDEFSFTNGVHTIRADVVFLINGIPIILIETKAATRLDGIAEGLDQVRRYHREGPELAAITQLFSLTHMIQYYYGATWNTSHKNLFNWKEESAGKDFETLVKTFVAPERVLRVLRDFILFTRKDDELQKVVLRPHQMRAVERALVRAHDTTKQRGLIWHTQGSGKTYTMITIAKRLVEEPLFKNPTVLMLVDRTELETQLFGNLAAVGLGSVEVASSKERLKELLRNDTRGIIVSMIHKFDDIPANINTRSNIFVLVDEAHRTTGGDLGNYLMGALPNATYLGFTGTPVDKTAYGKGTFKVFGIDDPQGYLDKYSIAESVEDGTTVPLYYSLAPNELRVDRDVLEKEFLQLAEAEGVSDIEELNRVLDKAVNLKNMLKNRERVQRVAQYIAKHFKENVEPLDYKAFIVGVDREACCLLKEALNKFLPDEYSRVVISPGHNDPPELAKYHLSDEEEKAVRKAFIKSEALPKILIVTEKLLTGYDAPVLYCMYLDKPMRDHVLLQAIARVNRPYEDEKNDKRKPGGFVLDFVGIFENLEKALAFDSKDVQSVIEGLDVLKARFRERIAKGRDDYLPSVKGKTPDKAAEAALELFRDENNRQEYYGYFRELEDLYEILSPDPFLREFVEDYQRLADLYALLRSAYDNQGITDRELARKTAHLVQEHTQAGVIHEAVAIQEITPRTLRKIAESNQSDTVKVFNLLKSISKKVEDEAGKTPYLFTIGERAEAIIEAFKQRQVSTQEALKQLEELIKEINEAEKEQAERGISGEAFATLWILKQGATSIDLAENVAKQMVGILKEYPHWHTSDEQSRQIRRRLYSLLEQANIKDIPETVEKIMSIIKRR
ncbi:type I restriction endonuclease subunit R [Dehalococcoides mccartyi]|uniref:type I restriction endonuclease subunit R n=1 Tax=Dehalococcoides mccartyi TaxID=61435 RepID=UPI0003C83AF1|nr:type I restriction endonuclease subunit R [Dehalococcoides mccartyi]AHB13468.1 type I restriction enzyme, R subunit [Dehalococcoides mccartyi GY50]